MGTAPHPPGPIVPSRTAAPGCVPPETRPAPAPVVGVVRAQEGAGHRRRSLDSGHSRRDTPNDVKGVIMRFGNWRGVAIACALSATFVSGPGARQARADLFHHTIP